MMSLTLCHSLVFQPSTSSEEQKKIHKAMSSGDLAKVDTIRKNAQSDGRFVPIMVSIVVILIQYTLSLQNITNTCSFLLVVITLFIVSFQLNYI